MIHTGTAIQQPIEDSTEKRTPFIHVLDLETMLHVHVHPRNDPKLQHSHIYITGYTNGMGPQVYFVENVSIMRNGVEGIELTPAQWYNITDALLDARTPGKKIARILLETHGFSQQQAKTIINYLSDDLALQTLPRGQKPEE